MAIFFPMNKRSFLLPVIQITLGVILLFVLIQRAQPEQIGISFREYTWTTIILSTSIFLVAILLTSYNWKLILQSFGVHVAYGRVLGAVLSGWFYSTFIPSSLSMDVTRGLRLYQDARQGHQVALSVVIDRLTGLIVFAGVLAIGFPIFAGSLALRLDIPIGVLPIGMAMALAGALGTYVLRRKLVSFFKPYWEALQTLPDRSWVVARAVLISVVVHTLVAVKLWLLCRPFLPDISLFFCLFLVEVVTAAEFLPISVGGLGLREGIYVVVLGPLGVATGSAVAIGLAQYAQNVFFAFWGGLYELSIAVKTFQKRAKNTSEKTS
jgi:glycosyltransferase 2 family protein